jgi:hypothetical protein
MSGQMQIETRSLSCIGVLSLKMAYERGKITDVAVLLLTRTTALPFFDLYSILMHRKRTLLSVNL